MEYGYHPQPSAPPRYSDVFALANHEDGQSDSLAEPSVASLPPSSQPSPGYRPVENGYTYPPDNNFTMVRFIFCWTGVATECSGVTCRLCGFWYLLLGALGVANIILPYSLYHHLEGWPNVYLVLYIMSGVSFLLLSIMWFCTARFFYKTHPRKYFHDNQNYRLSPEANSGYIVCLFVFACSLFGAITLVLIHDIVAVCSLFDPPVQCVLPYYVITLTAIMAVITVVFLLFNCLCYYHFITRNAGRIF